MIRKYAEIFCWKNVSSFCSAKATHIFSAKNIRILCIESAKTVNKMTLNELVKLTMLWTTGPRSLSHAGYLISLKEFTWHITLLQVHPSGWYYIPLGLPDSLLMSSADSLSCATWFIRLSFIWLLLMCNLVYQTFLNWVDLTSSHV